MTTGAYPGDREEVTSIAAPLIQCSCSSDEFRARPSEGRGHGFESHQELQLKSRTEGVRIVSPLSDSLVGH